MPQIPSDCGSGHTERWPIVTYAAKASGNVFVGTQDFTGATVTGVGGTQSAGIYVPSEFGSAWSAACAVAGTTPAPLAFVGDRVTFGYNASSYANSWAGKIAADLKAAYGDCGSGFVSCSRSTLLSQDIASWPSGESHRWTHIDQHRERRTIQRRSRHAFSGDDNFHAYPDGRRFDRAGLLARGASLGDFTWTIDGVSQGTVSTAGADSTQVTEVAGLSAGSHTVVVTVASGQNQVVIHGFSVSRTTGVIVDNFARPGSTANRSSSTGSSAAFGKPIDWSGGGSYPVPAKCMVWAFGINDLAASVTEANFRQLLARVDVRASGGGNPRRECRPGADPAEQRDDHSGGHGHRLRRLCPEAARPGCSPQGGIHRHECLRESVEAVLHEHPVRGAQLPDGCDQRHREQRGSRRSAHQARSLSIPPR